MTAIAIFMQEGAKCGVCRAGILRGHGLSRQQDQELHQYPQPGQQDYQPRQQIDCQYPQPASRTSSRASRTSSRASRTSSRASKTRSCTNTSTRAIKTGSCAKPAASRCWVNKTPANASASSAQQLDKNLVGFVQRSLEGINPSDLNHLEEMIFTLIPFSS